MGSGSTIAACEAMELRGVGAERYLDYYELSRKAIPRLAALRTEADPDLQPAL